MYLRLIPLTSRLLALKICNSGNLYYHACKLSLKEFEYRNLQQHNKARRWKGHDGNLDIHINVNIFRSVHHWCNPDLKCYIKNKEVMYLRGVIYLHKTCLYNYTKL